MRALNVHEGPGTIEDEIILVVGSAIGEGALRISPDTLLGVELRRVSWQSFETQSTHALQQGSNRGPFVDFRVVEQHDDFASEVDEQVPEEVTDTFGIDVGAMKPEIESSAVAPRAERNPCDDRHLGTALPMSANGRLSPRCPGAQHQRAQLEAGFIHEYYVGAHPPGVFFTRGHSFAFHRLISVSSRSIARFSGF